jgi:hypothetical protein
MILTLVYHTLNITEKFTLPILEHMCYNYAMQIFYAASNRKPGPRAPGGNARKTQTRPERGQRARLPTAPKESPVIALGAALPVESQTTGSPPSLHLHTEIDMMRRVIKRLFSEAVDCQDSETLSKLLNALGLASVRVANLLRLETQLTGAETSVFSNYQTQINQALAQVVEELRSRQEQPDLENSE